MAVGITQLRDAPVDVLPEFTPPYVEVQTEALGLSAEEVEQLVTVPHGGGPPERDAGRQRAALGVGRRAFVDHAPVRARHRPHGCTSARAGAADAGAREPERVAAASDASAAVLGEPGHDDRAVSDEAVADRDLGSRSLGHETAPAGRARRGERVHVRPTRPPASGACRPGAVARQARDPEPGGQYRRKRADRFAAELPGGLDARHRRVLRDPQPEAPHPAHPAHADAGQAGQGAARRTRCPQPAAPG